MNGNNYLKNSIPQIGAKKQSKKPYSGAAHTPASQKGLGDYYGTGIVAKLGKLRDDSMGMQALSASEMKKPPKALA